METNRRSFLKGAAAAVVAGALAPQLAEAAPITPGPFPPLEPIPFPAWLPCDGRMLSTAAYPELYAAIGNTYGGDEHGFRLPDLRGHVGWMQGTHSHGFTAESGTHSHGFLTERDDDIHSHSFQTVRVEHRIATRSMELAPAGTILPFHMGWDTAFAAS